ncbi:hypothetical protein VOLCADRAFT_104620 [Volvox carteri f. nagariensis]|uniref:Myb-like domain-containing protein n=1 Tax=Volvox carteri f. nagariensis TaxID=3068 RepID=D8TUX7_VOLCA|nr:uncharacterized protein VOLCADRAFT_104620 [Volvox carteri f. nagariensis]EFJ48896.1 hypothetical protein VOLCADRAFT_104620 [Volvox carteri f. nagariensis]|eukprot:XP_002950228.1 hypothetical protein VOLCADRAFT_104620 [Volvox carteri f. nagariensis]
MCAQRPPRLTSNHISQLASSLKKNDILKKPKPSTKGIITYQYRPFKNAARTDGLELLHWLKCYKGANGVIREPDDSEYPYAKYNKKVQLYKYNDEEYDSLIRPESGNWTREETDYLYDLCEQFDLRWHVIFDRYEQQNSPTPRSLEDLKERYYNVARKLLVSRQGREAAVANSTIVKHPFNKQVEQDRKRALAALLARTQQQISEEHAILAEARAIEEKRKAEAMAARRAAAAAAAAAATTAATTATATAATTPAVGPAAAAPRTTSPSQPGRPAPLPAGPGGGASAATMAAAPMGAAALGPGAATVAAAPGAPRALSPGPMSLGGDLRHPADFEPAPPPGIPSLLDAEVKPFKPKPGVYLRGAHTQAMAAQQAAVMTGGSRAFKAVEATLTELACPVALYGPRVVTRSTAGAWLALRAEVIALHEMRRNLANRLNADTDRAARHYGGMALSAILQVTRSARRVRFLGRSRFSQKLSPEPSPERPELVGAPPQANGQDIRV